MKSTKRFMSAKDLIITPTVELLILLDSFACALLLHRHFHLSFLTDVVVFYLSLLLWTIVALRLLSALFPFREGVFSAETHPGALYIYNLYSFLCITNLSLPFFHALVPPLLRKSFYQLLGAKMGKGIISIGGRIWEPPLVTVEENAMMGDDSLLIPHARLMNPTDTLVLGKITIKQGATIGAKNLVMLGVAVGENSVVNAMSVVTMNTKIPAHEVWGGNPAKKVGEVPRLESPKPQTGEIPVRSAEKAEYLTHVAPSRRKKPTYLRKQRLSFRRKKPSFNSNPVLQSGSWALVTGTRSGIGSEFCRQLAAFGMNLILVARRKEMMQGLARRLREEFHVKTVVVDLDLSQPSVVSCLHSDIVAQGITIRLLVNNAASGHWGFFENKSSDFYERMLRLNIESMVGLCREFLPDLAQHPSSAVINVSSQAAYQPVPYMAVYAASKAFVQSFSLALYEEWKGRGVTVQTLVPGPTATEFDEKAGGEVTAIKKRGSAKEVVEKALGQLRKDQPVVVTVGGTYIQRLFGNLMPPKVVVSAVGNRFRPEGVIPAGDRRQSERRRRRRVL